MADTAKHRSTRAKKQTLTRQRGLRSGAPLWVETKRRGPHFERLRSDATTDVLVVGAGISGALIAEMLAADGFEVMVVDRRGAAQGSTPASTALVQYEIDVPLIHLAKQVGEGTAIRAWRRSRQALSNLSSRTDELQIDCARTPRASLYLAGNGLDAAGIKQEGEARREAGFETNYLSASALEATFGIKRPAALKSFGGFCADPVRLTKGYLAHAAANGAQLHAPEEVVDVVSCQRGVSVTLKSDVTIKAQIVIFATGYEFPKFVPLGGHSLHSTFAFATRPQRRRLWPEECMIWEASDPYLYLRTTEDGRVVMGGEDEDFSKEDHRDALLTAKVAAIGKKAQQLFPDLDATPQYSWAGTFGSSKDGLPTIAEIPRYPNCWAVLGYGGNGITFSRLAAEIIRTALCGGRDPDAEIFKFRRV